MFIYEYAMRKVSEDLRQRLLAQDDYLGIVPQPGVGKELAIKEMPEEMREAWSALHRRADMVERAQHCNRWASADGPEEASYWRGLRLRYVQQALEANRIVEAYRRSQGL